MMRLFRPLFSLALIACMAVGPVAAAPEAPRTMTAIDLLSIARAGSPLPSPDGKRVLYRVSQADWAANRTVSALWMVDAAGGTPRKMLIGGSGACWSPDSRTIAFIDKRKGDGHPQLYALAADGGEARRLAKLRTTPSELQWSGDGTRIYYLADQPLGKAAAARQRERDDMTPFEAPRRRRALWVVDVATETSRQLIHGDFDVRSFDVSPDGRVIVYRKAASRLLDDQSASELWLHVDGAADVRLTDNDYQEMGPRLSADGRSILFRANARDGRYGTVNANLFVLDIASRAIREIADGPDWAIEDALWSADGRAIYFTAQQGVRTGLFAVPARGGKWRQLAGGDSVVSAPALSANGKVLSYVERSARQPEEVFRIDPARAGAVQLSHLNDGIAAAFRLPRQEAIRWTATDGQPLEGLVTYPLDYVPGRRYPMVVQSHGGPRSADQFNIFAYGRLQPQLAARGFVVLSVNYRGGTGYGDAFLQGMNGGYFRLADKDVLSGVDELVRRGIADADRLGMMGWSAGGHMTARLETVTDRFKAAIVGAGAVDWPSMYLLSDTRWQRREWFVTPPYGTTARRDLYQEYSPLAAVDKVRTPTLILAGAEDKRVPPSQSVMYYRALKALGVEASLYLAPREPHNFRELRHRLFQMNAEMDWLLRHVVTADYVWERTDIAYDPALAGAGDDEGPVED
ncbi:prolyl oligopeptidase family serine peptidase [Sphingomonas sp. CJ20]